MPNDQQTNERLEKILQGAFAGAPMPLKEIPTRWGKRRKDQSRKRRRQRKNRAA